MPHTHHSHSGQFCSHARDSLRDILVAARERNMRTVCLTEHVPRSDKHLYPEETAAHESASKLNHKFWSFMNEARQLASENNGNPSSPPFPEILVGFETEWICHDTNFDFEKRQVENLLAGGRFDMFIGSVHHVRQIPIDFDIGLYTVACSVVNTAYGLDESVLPEEEKHHKIFVEYFDTQYEMLKALKPPVVGHFDLIRLFSAPSLRDPEQTGAATDANSLRFVNNIERRWPDLWYKIKRNLVFIKEYNGVLELNSAALRKGLSQPYPQSEICQAWNKLGGRFVLSDDSHAIDQLGTHYRQLFQFIKLEGLTNALVRLTKKNGNLEMVPVDYSELKVWAEEECG